MTEDIHAQREAAARAKIQALSGTPEGEFGPDLFAEHHLEEIEESYWTEKFGASKPDAKTILNALVLVNKWDSEDDGNIDTYDFSLPDEVTDYLLSVRFDGNGEIKDVDMES